MSKPLIKITNIKRDFALGNEIVYVLKGINLEIQKGEYVALMGPSGSGKSTLMNLLGCLDTPTSGSYILNGKDVSQMHDDELADIRNKEIGFIFQVIGACNDDEWNVSSDTKSTVFMQLFLILIGFYDGIFGYIDFTFQCPKLMKSSNAEDVLASF